jgi:hypothetical protein
MPHFTPIGHFLDADETAHRIAAQAALLLRLREAAAQAIPETLRRYASIASHKQGKVVIFADNNAIAAKLRLFEPALIDVWARQGLQVSAVRVEVQPTRGGSVGRIKHARLTPAAEQALADLASGLPDGSPLREAINGLSRRARREG